MAVDRWERAVEELRARVAPPVRVQRLEHTPSQYRVVPLDAAVIARSHEMSAIPAWADRLIAATVQPPGLPLITRDPEISRVLRHDVLW